MCEQGAEQIPTKMPGTYGSRAGVSQPSWRGWDRAHEETGTPSSRSFFLLGLLSCSFLGFPLHTPASGEQPWQAGL